MHAATILLDCNLASRAILRVGTNPVGGLRVVLHLGVPSSNFLTRSWGMSLVLASEAKAITACTRYDLSLDHVSSDGIAAVGSRAPCAIIVVFDKGLGNESYVFCKQLLGHQLLYDIFGNKGVAPVAWAGHDGNFSFVDFHVEVVLPTVIAEGVLASLEGSTFISRVLISANEALSSAADASYAAMFGLGWSVVSKLPKNFLAVLKVTCQQYLLLPSEVSKQITSGGIGDVEELGNGSDSLLLFLQNVFGAQARKVTGLQGRTNISITLIRKVLTGHINPISLSSGNGSEVRETNRITNEGIIILGSARASQVIGKFRFTLSLIVRGLGGFLAVIVFVSGVKMTRKGTP
jgi:hypothetical protein